MQQNNRSLTEKQKQCIAACTSCAQICETCSDDMIGMGRHDDHDLHDLMVRCIRLCRDCADICMLTAQWLSRSSSWSEEICRFCAEVCEQCARTCEQHAPQHPMCGQCAEECRRCAALSSMKRPLASLRTPSCSVSSKALELSQARFCRRKWSASHQQCVLSCVTNPNIPLLGTGNGNLELATIRRSTAAITGRDESIGKRRAQGPDKRHTLRITLPARMQQTTFTPIPRSLAPAPAGQSS